VVSNMAMRSQAGPGPGRFPTFSLHVAAIFESSNGPNIGTFTLLAYGFDGRVSDEYAAVSNLWV
jgi:hypothetical protein